MRSRQAQLGQDVLAVPLDGPPADVQEVGDLLARVRLGDELDHLLLARGQLAGRRPRRIVEPCSQQ